MPKLWEETIDAHRRAVRHATLDTAAALIAEHGPLSVTMSRIAGETGIGRATLYKYFPDVESILVAWHHRQAAEHLARLAEVRDHAPADQQVAVVLGAFALMVHEHGTTDVAAIVHRDRHLDPTHLELRRFVAELLAAGAAAGRVRADVHPDELAAYCLHALAASAALPSKAAVRRLVAVVLTGLRPDDRPPAADR